MRPRRPIRAHRALLLLGGLALASCSDAADAPTPALPGVEPGSREWSWRDVLGRPLPGEPPAASDALRSERATERIDALDALVSARDPRAAATAMAALRDETIGVAVSAAHVLGELGAKSAIPRLLAGIGPYPVDYDVPIAVRTSEASALARLGNPAGVPLLLAVIAEGTALQLEEAQLPWPRTEQVAFIQELAVPGLRALAGTDFGFLPTASVPAREESVRKASEWWTAERLRLWAAAPVDDAGLEQRARMMLANLGAYQLRQIDAARFVLARLGPGVVSLLEPGLAHTDDYVRLHALEILERVAENCEPKPRARIATLATAPLLDDPVAAVAAQAARTVGATGTADALIIALKRRGEPEVVVSVIDALGRARRLEGLAALDEFAASLAERPPAAGVPADVTVALEAARLALDCKRDPAALLEALASPDRERSFAALDRLIALTGGNCGLDPSLPPDQRSAALATAREKLLARCSE